MTKQLSLFGRNIPNPLRMRCDIIKAVGEVDAFIRWWACGDG